MKHIAIIVIVSFLFSCSTTHYVKENKHKEANYKTIIEDQSKENPATIELSDMSDIEARKIEFDGNNLICIKENFEKDTIDLTRVDRIKFSQGRNVGAGAVVGAATGMLIIIAGSSDQGPFTYALSVSVGVVTILPITTLGGIIFGALSENYESYVFNENSNNSFETGEDQYPEKGERRFIKE